MRRLWSLGIDAPFFHTRTNPRASAATSGADLALSLKILALRSFQTVHQVANREIVALTKYAEAHTPPTDSVQLCCNTIVRTECVNWQLANR